MPPVFGPWSPSKTRLWSCVGRKRQAIIAIAQADEADFFALEKLFDDKTSGPELCDGVVGLGAVLRDHDTFTRRQAIGLNHDRK